MASDPDQPIFTAADLLARKREMGLLPKVQPPQAVILTFQSSILDYTTRKYSVTKISGFAGSFHLLKRSTGRVGVLGKFGLGAPMAAALVDELAAWGVRQFIGIGYAAGLQPEMKSGELVLCSRARCADGTSGHYMSGADWVEAAPDLLQRWGAALQSQGQPYGVGGSWTTDAPYRELRRDVVGWQQAGLLTVEMESAAILSVAKHYGLSAACGFAVADSLANGQWQYGDMKMAESGLRTLLDTLLKALNHE